MEKIIPNILGRAGKCYASFNTAIGILQTMLIHPSKARNPRSGAHGIAQALPASKMDKVGTDWRTNPTTQIKWGLLYISERYDSPCAAWNKWRRSNYY